MPTLLAVMLLLWIARRVDVLRKKRARRQASENLPSRADLETIAAALRKPRHTTPRCASPATSTALVSSPTSPSTGVLSSSMLMSPPEECVICLASEAVNAVELLPCGHSQFCAHCVVELLRSTRAGARSSDLNGQRNDAQRRRQQRPLRCPLCRQSVEFVCPAFVVRDVALLRRRCTQSNADAHSSDADAATTFDKDCDATTLPSRSACTTEDDVVLLVDYNPAISPQRCQLSWTEWCILWLRAIINVQHLPSLIGFRIALLHLSVLVYLLLPASYLPETAGSHTVAPSTTATAAAAGLHSAEPASNGWLGVVSLSAIGGAVLWQLRLLAIGLKLATDYVDDMFIVLTAVLLTGHLLQRALFYDVRDSAS